MKRVARFLRSVMPADPWQLVFLSGTILLFISPHLRVLPKWLAPADGMDQDRQQQLAVHISLFSWPIIFASLVAYYTCFWSEARPIRRIVLAVFLPALVGLCLILNGYFQLSQLRLSALEARPDPTIYSWFWSNVLRFPIGIDFCVLGLFLLGFYTIRIQLGLSSLPISLNQSVECAAADADSWKQYERLIFVLVCPYFIIAGLFALPLSFPYLFGWPHLAPSPSAFRAFERVFEPVIMFGVLFLTLRKAGRDAARRAIHLPDPRYVGFAALIPAIIGLAGAALPYTIDRVRWATRSFGQTAPPQFYSYFDVGRAWDPWLLLVVFAAFGEEVVFRGALLPALLRRYGFHRGIFFTGLLWAAVHFRADSYSGLSTAGVFYHLLYRILVCLVWNYVFSWMALRWKSVLPSTGTHGVSNMLAYSGIGSDFAWSAEVHLALWALLAWVLFRYRPLRQEADLVSAKTPQHG